MHALLGKCYIIYSNIIALPIGACVTAQGSYLLTPLSRVLEKLTGSQPVKKFPTIYGSRRFITAFTSDRHLSLS